MKKHYLWLDEAPESTRDGNGILDSDYEPPVISNETLELASTGNMIRELAKRGYVVFPALRLADNKDGSYTILASNDGGRKRRTK
jgi:hypothetical protein